jgi:hypothetical protein
MKTISTVKIVRIFNDVISNIVKNYDNWYLNLFENYKFLAGFSKELDIDMRIIILKDYFNKDFSLQNKYLKYKSKYLRLKKKLIYKNIK